MRDFAKYLSIKNKKSDEGDHYVFEAKVIGLKLTFRQIDKVKRNFLGNLFFEGIFYPEQHFAR